MKTIQKFMEKYHMIARGDRVIAGVSGGADSVCLFFVLLELRQTMGFELMAVHVNHGLRGEASDADEQFVRNLCGRFDIPLEVSRADVELIAKKRKQSLEETGRNVRREAFLTALEKYGADKVALAHHQNDNAETLLWNLCRGSGLTGLGGIRPVNGVYIRPLLCMTRAQIEQFLAEREQPYCTDATNEETEYTRNRLRHLVIPVLEKEINSRSVRHMNETMQQMQQLEAYMESQACLALQECVVRETNGCCLIRKERFLSYPRILQTYMVRACLELLHGQLADFEQIHVEQILDLFEKQTGRRICLPKQVSAERVYGGVRLCREEESCAAGKKKTESAPVFLQIPGETCLPEWNMVIQCRIMKKPQHFLLQKIPENVYTKWFDYDIIERSLCIRGKKAGDRITIDKAGHTKKLKAWFVNEKIPACTRAEIPLLASGDDILWIIGYRMSSAYQISERTEQILQITVSEYKKIK